MSSGHPNPSPSVQYSIDARCTPFTRPPCIDRMLLIFSVSPLFASNTWKTFTLHMGELTGFASPHQHLAQKKSIPCPHPTLYGYVGSELLGRYTSTAWCSPQPHAQRRKSPFSPSVNGDGSSKFPTPAMLRTLICALTRTCSTLLVFDQAVIYSSGRQSHDRRPVGHSGHRKISPLCMPACTRQVASDPMSDSNLIMWVSMSR